MHRFQKFLLLIALSTIMSPLAAAAAIDQNAPVNSAYMAAFSQTGLAQSFQQASSVIAGAGIFLQPNLGTTDNVTISLWDNLPNASGNMLASASAVGTQGSWLDVFWAPVAIIPDTTYYLVFTGSNDTLGIAGDLNNGYSRGNVFANVGFVAFPEFDYAFRTYAAAVPEPETYAMMLAGLGLLGFVSRRRGKQQAV